MSFLTNAAGIYSSGGAAPIPELTWTNNTGDGISDNIYGVCYGNGYFVCVTSTFKLYYTTDPTGAWTYKSDVSASQGESIAYDGTNFVACGGSLIYYCGNDPSGTWTLYDIWSGFAWRDVTYFSGVSKWIMCGDNAHGTYATAVNSWSNCSLGSGQAFTISAGPSLAVSTSNSVAISTSSTGTSWTSRSHPFGTSQVWGNAYGNSLWVFGAQAGKLATSSDPTSSITLNTTTRTWPYVTYDAVYYDGLWCCVGTSGGISTTEDPTGKWQANTSGTANSLRRIVHANGYWVAVGNSGTVLTAPDL